jgi:hypothetical protein
MNSTTSLSNANLTLLGLTKGLLSVDTNNQLGMCFKKLVFLAQTQDNREPPNFQLGDTLTRMARKNSSITTIRQVSPFRTGREVIPRNMSNTTQLIHA